MAKSSIHFATGPATVDNLRACVARAVLEGVDLTYRGKLSRSRIIDTAIRYGAEASVAALQPAPVALPERATPTDAERLKAARAASGLSSRRLAELLGYKHKTSIQNVEIRGFPMSDKIRAWVEQQESSR
jgi:molybdenum cofactor biosynthesis enzyme